MVALQFDQQNALIEVTNPQVTVDVQTLIDEIRAEEASELGITYGAIAGASGKESLGGSVSVGLTVELLNNWQVHFWEGNYIAKISGGNLVGGIGGDPVAYSAGVQVLLIQSAASTVVSVGGSALTETESDYLRELWQINGLDPLSPLQVTGSARTAGTIEQSITGDGESSSTVTRET